MSLRIRYQSDSMFVIKSVRSYTIGDASFFVYVNTEESMYEIRNAVSGAVAFSGSGKSLANVKKKAKAALVEMGYTFASETRVRKEDDIAADARRAYEVENGGG